VALSDRDALHTFELWYQRGRKDIPFTTWYHNEWSGPPSIAQYTRLLEGERLFLFQKEVENVFLRPRPPAFCDNARRNALKAFKINYDNSDEINLRLGNSIIQVDQKAYVVRGVSDNSVLSIKDHEGRFYYLDLAEVPDLRTPPACYVVLNNRTSHLERLPRRVQRQGITSDNTGLKPVGSTEVILGGWRADHLLLGLNTRSDLKYSPAFRQLFNAGVVKDMRLSDTVAIFNKNNEGDVDLQVEYKGRDLGRLEEDRVGLRPLDRNAPWLIKDLLDVGLRPKRHG